MGWRFSVVIGFYRGWDGGFRWFFSDYRGLLGLGWRFSAIIGVYRGWDGGLYFFLSKVQILVKHLFSY